MSVALPCSLHTNTGACTGATLSRGESAKRAVGFLTLVHARVDVPVRATVYDMTTPVGPIHPTPVDWMKIGQRFQEATVHYTHHAEVTLYGDEFYAAVAKRALGGHTSERITYETVNRTLGLMTEAESEWHTSESVITNRMRAERAEEQVKEMRAEVRRVRRDAARDLVKYLREWCNERRIPARLRREGFLMAADQVDPDIQRDQYGNVVRDGAA